MSQVGGSADLGEVQLIWASLMYVCWSASSRLKACNWLAGPVGITDPHSFSSLSRYKLKLVHMT